MRYLTHLILVLLGLMTLTETGLAKKKKKPQVSTYVPKCGMAGCDFWAEVVDNRERLPQLGVWALRQFIVNSQSSAISSGTSGCVPKKSDYAAMEQKVFIDVNLASLSSQAARGEGEHLSALAEVFGCDDTDKFAKFSRDHYGKIFSAYDSERVFRNYVYHVKTNRHNLGSCIRV